MQHRESIQVFSYDKETSRWEASLRRGDSRIDAISGRGAKEVEIGKKVQYQSEFPPTLEKETRRRLQSNELRELQELRDEILRLKNSVASMSFERQTLKEILEKKF